MCIFGGGNPAPPPPAPLPPPPPVPPAPPAPLPTPEPMEKDINPQVKKSISKKSKGAVSYTHLTLPTKCSV